MRYAAWLFSLLVLVFLAALAGFALVYPQARFGLLGVGPYRLWVWLGVAFAWGALSMAVWVLYLYLRCRAERRRARELERELEGLRRRERPKEIPRIPDRDLE